MNAEDWLGLLLFIADQLTRPTLHNLCGSYEDFERRMGLGRALRRWEQKGWATSSGQAQAVVYRLTEQGRLRLEPFPDPRPHWDAPWDSIWRLFMFDMPSHERRLRLLLWRWLREHRFGYLQNSVWIKAQPVMPLIRTVTWFQDNPEMFLVMESRRVAGDSDEAIVAGAWDFTRINGAYRRYLEVVETLQASLKKRATVQDLAGAVRQERAAYGHAIVLDPLLPKRLWPADYLGQVALRARTGFQQQARRLIEAQAHGT